MDRQQAFNNAHFFRCGKMVLQRGSAPRTFDSINKAKAFVLDWMRKRPTQTICVRVNSREWDALQSTGTEPKATPTVGTPE